MTFVVTQDKVTGLYTITPVNKEVVITTDSSSKSFDKFIAARQYVIDRIQERINALLDQRGAFMTLQQEELLTKKGADA